MIEPESHERLRREIGERIRDDQGLLEALRAEIRPLRQQVQRIQARTTTSISLVGTDGGNNSLEFDPFLVQVIRVVDSSNNEYCLEAITPTTSVKKLSEAQFRGGDAVTALGEMMKDLGVSTLPDLTHMIRLNDTDSPTSPSWVQVYREIVEWAVLYSILKKKEFGTDTLIVCDGLLRSKVFAGHLFKKYSGRVSEAIKRQWYQHRRRIYVVGVPKKS